MIIAVGANLLNYSRLVKIAREHPAVRELRLSTPDYREFALKAPTMPAKSSRPADAGDDWTPPAPELPSEVRFMPGQHSIRVTANDKLQRGQVEAT